MRKPIIIVTTIAIAASSCIVVPQARAWSKTCQGVVECRELRTACAAVGGSYGGYVDPWDFQTWGICVVPDKMK